ncbi:MAG: hypothetical protein JRI23_07320 [Deltaproteobacteria bacterium]|jgi:hypothetical protein|nr:hypothetical protein [Deltaproteobacteria bacterium]MBW2531403.1 hypothetical protein [Deltaproteobacteria bacterium]
MRASSAIVAFGAACALAAGCGGDRATGGGASTATGGSSAGGAASGTGGTGGISVGGAGGGAGGVAVVPEHAELYVQWAMKTIQTGPGTVGYGFENLANHSEATESSGRIDNMWGWGIRRWWIGHPAGAMWRDVLEVRSNIPGEAYGDHFDVGRHPNSRSVRLKIFGGPDYDTDPHSRYHDGWHYAPGDWPLPAGGPSGLEGYNSLTNSGGTIGKPRVDPAIGLSQQPHMGTYFGHHYIIGFSLRLPSGVDGYEYSYDVSHNNMGILEFQNDSFLPAEDRQQGLALSMAEDDFYIRVHEFDSAGMEVDRTTVRYQAEKDVWFDFILQYRPEWTDSITRVWAKREHEDEYTQLVDSTVPVTGAYRAEMDAGWHMDFAFYMYGLSYSNLEAGRVWPSAHRVLSMQYAELRVFELEHDGSNLQEGWDAVDPHANRWSQP